LVSKLNNTDTYKKSSNQFEKLKTRVFLRAIEDIDNPSKVRTFDIIEILYYIQRYGPVTSFKHANQKKTMDDSASESAKSIVK